MNRNIKSLITVAFTFCVVFGLIGCSPNKKLSNAIANPAGVTKLKLTYAHLDSLPRAIEKLTDLKTLYLYRTTLDTLPAEIGNLKNLETLVISTSRMRTLPSSIGQLPKLKKIVLSHPIKLSRVF